MSLHKTLFLLLALCGLALPGLTAQCPPATEAGLHNVRSGETLTSIGRLYAVSVRELAIWNNISTGETLKPCQELVVSSSLTTPATSGFSGVKQSGKWHTVRRGETVELLADLYGYTARRFREFNDLPEWRVVNAGAVLRSSDCDCGGSAAGGVAPVGTFANAPTPTEASSAVTLGSSFNKPEVMATDRANMKVSESRMVDAINQMRANPSGFINEVRAFVARENAKPWRTRPINTTAVNTLIQRLARTPQLSILRAHPCLYQVAKTHGDYLKASNRFDHANARGEYPYSRVKNACPNIGTGRTQRADGWIVGNENLVGGYTGVDAVVYLLIDESAADRGHRETLLAPEWTYVTTYNFGTVRGIDNNFIQLFGE